MYGLIDCNNFFVSCEQVFNPKLRGRPVVILSNNDGCVISRSKEAKDLGIPMGAPAFQHRETFFHNDVAVLSSNFALYGDLSERVMATLETFGFPLDIYSIDEAFLDLPEDADEALGKKIRNTVLQWTGIPISMGIAKTKTLAKAGSEFAKKKGGVLVFDRLDHLPIEEVWGIGSKTAESLHQNGIRLASELVERSDEWIQKQFSVSLLRTVWELRGISCIPFEEIHAPRKGIVTSRTFGRAVTTLQEMKEAVATFTAIAAEKLREQESLACHLTVFIIDKERFSNAAYIRLPTGSSYTPELMAAAACALSQIYKDGVSYRKAGVMFNDLISETHRQLDLFAPSKHKNLMPLIDTINRKTGKKALFFAAEGTANRWKGASSRCSPHFTTDWDDLLTVRCRG